MRRNQRLAASLLLCVPLLAGCGASQPVVISAPRMTIPVQLKTCPPQPEPPADGSGDRALANWILDLADAGQSCRDTLTSLVKAIGQ